MGFFTLSDDTEIENISTEFDGGGGLIEPIPAGTQVLAFIEETTWVEPKDITDNSYISIVWVVTQPEQHKEKKIRQKIQVNSNNVKKSDKARRMFAAIDANAGGKLIKLKSDPTDVDFAKHLVNKLMVVMIQIWKGKDKETGDIISGNWISAISPKSSELKAPPVNEKSSDDFDDDIGF